MTPDDVERLIPLAAELVGCVRDYGDDAVAEVLARVPGGRHDALAVVLAAMVDPDARPQQLLAWLDLGPVPSRTFTPAQFHPNARKRRMCPTCGVYVAANHLARHKRTHETAVA